MNNILLIVADYLKGKEMYPAFRRILNLLFNISIASFIYEMIYGPYHWIDITDYKSILDFFIKGHFFIPFSIFVIVSALSQIFGIVVFSVINHQRSIKLNQRIVAYELNKEDLDSGLNVISEVSTQVTATKITAPQMVELYQKLRKEVKPEDFRAIELNLLEPKNNLKASFTLTLRILLAMSIYFISLPKFGWLLYCIIVLTLVLILFCLVLAHRLLDILPTLIRKFFHVAESYLAIHIKNETDKSKGTRTHRE